MIFPIVFVFSVLCWAIITTCHNGDNKGVSVHFAEFNVDHQGLAELLSSLPQEDLPRYIVLDSATMPRRRELDSVERERLRGRGSKSPAQVHRELQRRRARLTPRQTGPSYSSCLRFCTGKTFKKSGRRTGRPKKLNKNQSKRLKKAAKKLTKMQSLGKGVSTASNIQKTARLTKVASTRTCERDLHAQGISPSKVPSGLARSNDFKIVQKRFEGTQHILSNFPSYDDRYSHSPYHHEKALLYSYKDLVHIDWSAIDVAINSGQTTSVFSSQLDRAWLSQQDRRDRVITMPRSKKFRVFTPSTQAFAAAGTSDIWLRTGPAARLFPLPRGVSANADECYEVMRSMMDAFADLPSWVKQQQPLSLISDNARYYTQDCEEELKEAVESELGLRLDWWRLPPYGPNTSVIDLSLWRECNVRILSHLQSKKRLYFKSFDAGISKVVQTFSQIETEYVEKASRAAYEYLTSTNKAAGKFVQPGSAMASRLRAGHCGSCPSSSSSF